MDLSAIRSLGESLGYEEVLFSARDRVIVFELPDSNAFLKGLSISVWYQHHVVGVVIPSQLGHVKSQVFHFHVTSLTQCREILNDPLSPSHEAQDFSFSSALKPLECNLHLALSQYIQFLNNKEKQIASERERTLTLLKSLASQFESSQEITSTTKQVDSEHSASNNPPNNNTRSFHATLTSVPKRNLTCSKTLASSAMNHSKVRAPQSTKSTLLIPKQQESLPTNKTTSALSQQQTNHYENSPRFFMTQQSYTGSESKSTAPEAFKDTCLNESPSRFKGNRCLFCFANDMYHEEFGRAWSAKPVKEVALGRGYIIVYEDGGVAWWDTPKELEQRFSNPNIPLPPVQFVALGSNDNYFIKFTTGKMEWVAVDSLQTAIRSGVVQRQFSVSKVSLGANGSWVILWSHGLVEFEGVPSDMATILEAENRPGAVGLRDVSLGPHDEWFVIFKDHSVQANNLPDSLHAALVKIKEEGGRLRSVVFGHDTSWYVRLWDGKLHSHD